MSPFSINTMPQILESHLIGQKRKTYTLHGIAMVFLLQIPLNAISELALALLMQSVYLGSTASISKYYAGSRLALVEELSLPEFTTCNFRLTSESEVRSIQK